ncbi:MAG: hypothetical protein HYS13_17085 [Planctomycetia bacterium]|nr:hypothetical protein [Planctomycetia bacterium]
MDGQRIADGEVVYRRIALCSPWFEPPHRLTSANFKLRAGELGVSVFRGSVVSAEQVLARLGAVLECRVACATVGEIRRLTNAKGEPFKLDVIADDATEAGHAEIRGPTPGALTSAAAKALSRLFHWV